MNECEAETSKTKSMAKISRYFWLPPNSKFNLIYGILVLSPEIRKITVQHHLGFNISRIL